MKTIIRNATINDLKRIQELNNKLFEKEYDEYDKSLKVGWPFLKQGEEYFKNLIENDFVIVADIDKKIIGYLAGNINSQSSYNISKIAELDNMFILEEYRNCGIGKQLIVEFINYCEFNGISDIRVTASFKNKEAIKFYMKNGFEEFELTLRKTNCNKKIRD